MARLLSTIIDGFISSKKFVSGLMGEGWRIGKRGSRYALEVDDIIVRNTMTVFELLISKIRAVRGAMAITQAFGKVKDVREEEDRFILTLEDENTFMVNDLLRCKAFGEGAREYWVKVSFVSGLEITISKTEFDENMSTPRIGDELVQMGNTTDTTRQSAIYLSADENGIPAIDVLQGIREKSLEGCVKVRVGGLDGMVDSDFPDGIKDFGIYCDNGYFKGTIAGGGGYMLRSDGTGYICNGAIWWDEQKKVHFDGEVVLEWENLPPDAKELLKGDKGDAGEKGEDANLLAWVEEWNSNKTMVGGDSLISPKIFSGKQESDGTLTGVAIGREVIEMDGKKKTGIFGLQKGKPTFTLDAETGEAMYKGKMNVNDQFEVDANGKMIAMGADVSGRIVANEGKIGGFEIEDGNLTVGDPNTNKYTLISRSRLTLQNMEAYIEGVVSSLKVDLGVSESYGSKAPFYFYRKDSGLNAFKPAMRIESESGANVCIALITKGSIISDRAVISSGFCRMYSAEYTTINLWYGTNIEIHTTVYRYIYLPPKERVFEVLGETRTFMIRLTILCFPHNTEDILISASTNVSIIYDYNNSNFGDIRMSRGDVTELLLVWDGETYYGKILNRNT